MMGNYNHEQEDIFGACGISEKEYARYLKNVFDVLYGSCAKTKSEMVEVIENGTDEQSLPRKYLIIWFLDEYLRTLDEYLKLKIGGKQK